MAKYECVDEMTIEATPSECFASLADEVSGRSAWWEPFVVMTTKEQGTPDEDGPVIERLASPDGTTERYWSTARIRLRVAETERDRRLVIREEGGDFRGFEEWTFEPLDGDRTLVRVHWVAEPHGLMRLIAPFGRVEQDHSLIIHEGLRGMEHHIRQRRRISRAGLEDDGPDRPRG